jgi:hypothetical protein
MIEVVAVHVIVEDLIILPLAIFEHLVVVNLVFVVDVVWRISNDQASQQSLHQHQFIVWISAIAIHQPMLTELIDTASF